METSFLTPIFTFGFLFLFLLPHQIINPVTGKLAVMARLRHGNCLKMNVDKWKFAEDEFYCPPSPISVQAKRVRCAHLPQETISTQYLYAKNNEFAVLYECYRTEYWLPDLYHGCIRVVDDAERC